MLGLACQAVKRFNVIVYGVALRQCKVQEQAVCTLLPGGITVMQWATAAAACGLHLQFAQLCRLQCAEACTAFSLIKTQ
jgi:hypothetical protein